MTRACPASGSSGRDGEQAAAGTARIPFVADPDRAGMTEGPRFETAAEIDRFPGLEDDDWPHGHECTRISYADDRSLAVIVEEGRRAGDGA